MVSYDNLIIKGAKAHNLKNVSLEIPKNKVVVFTGVSGSGKSSLVFDTIYTEAQRQLIETFSSFARSRLPKLTKPDVDEIENLSTSIVINQKKMGKNIRSTIGTATELYTYLRLLYSRAGDKFIGPSYFFGFNHPEGMCPNCGGLGKKIQIDVNQLIDWDKTIREGAIKHPDYIVGRWMWREIVGINLFNPDKKLKDFNKKELNDFLYSKGIPIEKKHGAGTYMKNFEGIVRKLERLYLNKVDVKLSSGRKSAYTKMFIESNCTGCNGSRLNKRARSVKINDKSIAELLDMELTDLDNFLKKVKGKVAEPIIRKSRTVLSYLIDIGVGYLSLNRPVGTLSGGESQRVKMARQLDCNLVDLMYIMDEPSIGLHPKDVNQLINMLYKLRDKGNSVFVVEHDTSVINCADYIVDIGPRAGRFGGKIVYQGSVNGLKKSDTITGELLGKDKNYKFKRKPWEDFILIENANLHNLKNLTVKLPKKVFTCITGIAGSGKSSLINDVFLQENKNAVVIDQSPVGRTSRGNPMTYTDIFSLIRKEFSKATRKSPSLFSFNSKGACPKCNGLGTLSIEMSFLDSVSIPCDECKGQRFKDEVLNLKYKGKNIFEALNLTVQDAVNYFENKEIKRRLQVLVDVGLHYLTLGQPLSTLSGGEAQRIKLAKELHKKGNIYVMDEPSTGMHKADVNKLLNIIKRLVENNNTVIVIEHNLDIIKFADWVIDLGPEGGKKGGEIIAQGTPEDVTQVKKSYTGQYLKKIL